MLKESDDVEIIRQSIYTFMGNDKNLIAFLKDYFKVNKENIPFDIKN